MEDWVAHGKSKSGHKYISRIWKNGRWRYRYNDVKQEISYKRKMRKKNTFLENNDATVHDIAAYKAVAKRDMAQSDINRNAKELKDNEEIISKYDGTGWNKDAVAEAIERAAKNKKAISQAQKDLKDANDTLERLDYAPIATSRKILKKFQATNPVMKLSREASYNLAEFAKKKLKHSEEEAMDYYATTSTVGDDYICHRSHRYISRVWKNGKWRYYYAGDIKGSKSQFGAAARMVADDVNLDRTARHIGVAIRNKMDKSGTTGRIRSAVSRLHDKYDNESAFKRNSRHLQEAAKTKLETSGATSTARNAKLKVRDTADQVDDYARKRLKLDSGSAARSAVNNIASSAKKAASNPKATANSIKKKAKGATSKAQKAVNNFINERKAQQKRVNSNLQKAKKSGKNLGGGVTATFGNATVTNGKTPVQRKATGKSKINLGGGVTASFGTAKVTKKKKR